MSGSNCICVVTALLETGRVKMTEPGTIVRVETPAGLILARAKCERGRCVSVSLDNVPCFAEALDRKIETPRWGTILSDIAFGGVYYALVDAERIGLTIEPGNARDLAEAGIALRTLVNAQVKVRHPELAGLDDVAYVMFRALDADGAVRTCTVLKPGRVDRSPCGTGSSANLACLHARGGVKVGDQRLSRSIIGGEFLAEAIGETIVGNRRACFRASPAEDGFMAAKNSDWMAMILSRAVLRFRTHGVRKLTSWNRLLRCSNEASAVTAVDGGDRIATAHERTQIPR